MYDDIVQVFASNAFFSAYEANRAAYKFPKSCIFYRAILLMDQLINIDELIHQLIKNENSIKADVGWLDGWSDDIQL